MPSTADRAYLLSRAKEERDLAADATNPTVALIHQQLADEYGERADDETGEEVAPRGVCEAPGVDKGVESSSSGD